MKELKEEKIDFVCTMVSQVDKNTSQESLSTIFNYLSTLLKSVNN